MVYGYRIYEEFTTIKSVEGFNSRSMQLKITTCPPGEDGVQMLSKVPSGSTQTYCYEGDRQICSLSVPSDSPDSCSSFYFSILDNKGNQQCPKRMPNYYQQLKYANNKDISIRGCTYGPIRQDGTGPLFAGDPHCIIYNTQKDDLEKIDSCTNIRRLEAAKCFSSVTQGVTAVLQESKDSKGNVRGCPIIQCTYIPGSSTPVSSASPSPSPSPSPSSLASPSPSPSSGGDAEARRQAICKECGLRDCDELNDISRELGKIRQRDLAAARAKWQATNPNDQQAVAAAYEIVRDLEYGFAPREYPGKEKVECYDRKMSQLSSPSPSPSPRPYRCNPLFPPPPPGWGKVVIEVDKARGAFASSCAGLKTSPSYKSACFPAAIRLINASISADTIFPKADTCGNAFTPNLYYAMAVNRIRQQDLEIAEAIGLPSNLREPPYEQNFSIREDEECPAKFHRSGNACYNLWETKSADPYSVRAAIESGEKY